jgi:hypothetical protein
MSDDNKHFLEVIAEVLNRGSETEHVSVESSTAGDGNVMVSFKRVPIPDYAWNKGDGSILDWREKFEREEAGDFPPFKPGEYVRVSGFVQPDPEGLYKVHVDADGRIADNFFVKEVSDPDPLADSVGMPLEVILEVGEERKADFRISDIWNYDAKLAGILSRPLVNPEGEDIEDLQSGKRVIVKGRFKSYGKSSLDRFLEGLGYPEGSRLAGESSTGTITITQKLMLLLKQKKVEK